MKIHDGDHLKLGTLDGNQFEILLRDCSIDSENESKKPKIDLSRPVSNNISKKNPVEKNFRNNHGIKF